jgi:hypothetical protein
VTVERSPAPGVKENTASDFSQRSQVPEPTFPEAMQRVLTLEEEEEEGKWLPGAGKSPKSLELLRRKMKREHSEALTQGVKRRRSSRTNENFDSEPYNSEQRKSEAQKYYTSWTPEEYSLLQHLRDSHRPVPWREVVKLLSRDLRDVKATWKAREQWIHLVPRQLVQWDEDKVFRTKDLLTSGESLERVI